MPRTSALLILHSKSSDQATGRLPSPEADLSALAATLTDSAIGDFEVADLVNGSVQQMREAIVQFFRSAGPEDVRVLYYAGHALRDPFGEIYLTATDTRPEALEATALRLGFLGKLLDRSRGAQHVVILDSPITAAGEDAQELLGSPAGILTALHGNGRSRYLICASDQIEAALQGTDLIGQPGQSPLASWLGEGLRSGSADRDGDGEITVHELFEFVSEQARSAGPSRTQPSQWSSPGTGEIVLGHTPASAAIGLPEELESAVRSRHGWMRQGAVGELERLLGDPDRARARVARQRLSELSRDSDQAIARSATAILQSHPAEASPAPPTLATPPSAPPAAAPARRAGVPAWGWLAGGLVLLFAVGLAAGASGLFAARQAGAQPQPSAAPTSRPVAEAPAAASPIPQAAGPTEPAEVSLPSSAGMVAIPAGTYTIASNAGIDLAAYWIDSFEVTNAEYAAYLYATGQSAPAYWEAAGIPEALGDHPVRMLTWDRAQDYCHWIGKRLPGEAEWEVAARGPDGLLYPWGDEDGAVALPTSDSYPVGSVPANRSVFGLYDMAGNVWEWVDQPYLAIREGQRILRGGANDFPNDMTYRLPGDPAASATILHAGFRCAADQVTVEPDPLLVLTDEFANILSGWYQAAEPVKNYFYGYHPTDFYHVQVSAARDCLAVHREIGLADFVAEASIFQAKTDTETGDYRHGLMLRQVATDFYAFTVSPRTDIWQFTKNSPAGTSLLAEGVESSIGGLAREEADRLAVVANGVEMTLYVNGRLVGRVYDDDYRDGNIGFFVETYDETYAHIHFDRVSVWRLPPHAVPVEQIPASPPSRLVGRTCAGAVSGDELLERFTTYTVKEGETLSLIADQFGLSIDVIKGANGRRIQDPNVIVAGQVLIIPES